jgi:hypothetical protein
MDRKAAKRRVRGTIPDEEAVGANTTDGAKTMDAEESAGRSAAAETGDRSRGISTEHPCARAQRGGGGVAKAAPQADDGYRRQRGCDEDERPRGCDDRAFRALCGMGFRAHEARRALGLVGQRRAGSPPAAIETLLREALAVLAP